MNLINYQELYNFEQSQIPYELRTTKVWFIAWIIILSVILVVGAIALMVQKAKKYDFDDMSEFWCGCLTVAIILGIISIIGIVSCYDTIAKITSDPNGYIVHQITSKLCDLAQ